MIRRGRNIALAFLLALTALGPTLADPPAAAASGCGDLTTHYHNGFRTSAADGYPNGVRADIAAPPVDVFHACTSPGDWGNDGASVWVSVTDDWSSLNDDEIIQIGIVSCNSFAFSYCENYAEKWSVWAVGGCGYAPYFQPIGRVYESPKTFSIIYYGSPSRWELKIDGVTQHTVYYSDPAVACWLSGPKTIGWFGELWDRGDHIGAICAGCKTTFDEMDYIDDAGGSWTNIDPSASTCVNGEPYDVPGSHAFYCNLHYDVYQHGQMNVWTEW